ncbi:putative membrane protein [Halobacteriovorax marinus SJ]|uniref:Membrane protein n=1 Tax=Halobacteriovorax marinus (strain ATCC BAA-682 / DSM 15412 / SJ) TaxID=862908 RepID=E1X4L6_HALMS|nr:hypothetical protein [Halobacteriovorax marinus]CBW25446.1 putative membrane protein [Halobacteriovorax marinus SJ]
MNYRPIILVTLLLASCGKSDIPTSSSALLEEGQEQVSDELQDSSTALLSPRFYNLPVTKFFFKKEALPSRDKRYVEIQFKLSDPKIHNNRHHPNGLKEILIKGKEVILTPGHQQGLFEQLHEMSDIEKVIIEAESIELTEKLSIPGASLELSAQSLDLSKGGQIDITPMDFSAKASGKNAGLSGQDAGVINLNIDHINFKSDRKEPLFILNGGRGQDGSLAEKGANGSKYRDLGGGVVYKEIITEECDILDPIRDRFDKRLICSEYTRREGTNGWPSNGAAGIPGSKPGVGGKGGVLLKKTSIPAELVLINGGESGKSSGVAKGGEAGVPKTAYHQVIYVDRHRRTHIRSNVSRTYHKGQDVESPSAESAFGEKGAQVIQEEKLSWVREGYLEKELLYGNDLYINNHIEEAKESFNKISKGILKLKNTESESLKINSIKGKLTESLVKINSQKDYFGHSVNWVPNYSLEANYSKFKSDLDHSFRAIYLSYWIKNSQKSLESKVEAIGQLQDNLLGRIEQSKENYNGLISKIPILKEKIDEFRVEQDFFAREVARVEAEINRMAANNVNSRNKTSFLKKALRTVSAISTVIPAGQPALGLVGSSLGIVAANIGEERSLSEIIKDSKSIYNNFKKMDIENSSHNWNEAWSKVKLSRVKEIENKDELKQYISDVTDFSAPIVKEIQAQAELWKSREVPKSEVDAEIRKIKASHTLFKSLTKNLENYMAKKKALVEEVNIVQQEISKALSVIQVSFDQISEVSYQKSTLLEGSDINITPLLDEIETEAKNRLLRYHYEMARAFEYRLLRPYPRNINLDSILEKLKMIVSIDKQAELSSMDYESLKSLYTNELSWIVDMTLSELNKEGLPLQRETVLRLSDSEVAALNNGDHIYLDLKSKEVFASDMEDIRINNIVIEDMDVQSSGRIGQSAELSLEIAYSGESFLKKGGQYYFFEKDVDAQKTRWGATLDLISGQSSVIESSPSAESLIRTLIGENSDEELMLLSRPGGLTQLKVKVRQNSFPKVDLKLEGARIRIVYDYNIF